MYCLIVDDDEDTLFISTKILVDAFGCFIRTAKTGEEALDLCNRQLPNIILLDWNMPGMTGLEFLSRLKKARDGYKVKVIMCTGEGDEKKVKSALQAGAKGYVLKPYSKEDICGQIENLGFKRNNTQ